MAQQPMNFQNINYDDELAKVRAFLTGFSIDIEIGEGRRRVVEHSVKYMEILQQIANREVKSIDIAMDDVDVHDEYLGRSIRGNTRRYRQLFQETIDSLLKDIPVEVPPSNDPIDILMQHRMAQIADQEEREGGAAEGAAANNNPLLFPAELTRRYDIHIIPGVADKAMRIRDVRAEQLGHLVTLRGVVTRVTEVKPLLIVGTYICDRCRYETYQEIDSPTVLPLTICSSPACREGQAKGRLQLETRGSKFVKFQELKLQERPGDVPQGEVPMMITVHVRGELTRDLSAGDWASITGVWMGKPMSGKAKFRQITQLLLDPYLEATAVDKEKVTYSNLQLTEDIRTEIERLQELYAQEDNDTLFNVLAKSIAPEIHGHLAVKKALLLQLVSGVTKVMGDGVRLRGDINICLMGDPAVAKSQLLRHIASISPRGVYTTGKGSSGVGLTAALVKDPATKEFTLEGGALVLADNGVCCIDEFDKMDDNDRTAIHEVMEQQTVSIAKAAITTTLNARAAVLAAANPYMGRYDTALSAERNLNLPASLLSRFDLMFLILDVPDPTRDEALAMHITGVHMFGRPANLDFEPIHERIIRHYIAEARRIEPYVPEALTDHITGWYLGMRKQGQFGAGDTSQNNVSPRTLLSIIRLAQAAARLRFTDEVTREDIDFACALYEESANSLKAKVEETEEDGGDTTARIFQLISDFVKRKNVTRVNRREIGDMVLQQGFTEEDFDECVRTYENVNVWHADENSIMFVMND